MTWCALLYRPARYLYARFREMPRVVSLVAMGFLGLLVLVFHNVITREGWPYNHDYQAMQFRTLVYAYHYDQFDFFPLWSSGEAGGMGSPLPLFYHKLFFWVSACFFEVLHHMQASIILACAVFVAVGCAGVFRFLRIMGLRIWPSVLIAFLLPLQHYAYTDWFVRGAVAEFSAMMVIPWLFVWCAHYLKTGVFGYSLVWVLLAVYFAHSIIGYYAVLIVLCAVAIRWNHHFEWAEVWSTIRRSVIAGVVFAGVMSIYLIPAYLVSDWYDPSKIKMNIVDFFKPLWLYFYDGDYSFHDSPNGYTVQVSGVVWISIGVLTLWWMIHKAVVRERVLLPTPAAHLIRLHLMASMLFCFLLQLSLSMPFYFFVPGADFIQFPWRLLSFIEVSLILVIGLMVLRVSQAYGKNAALGMTLLMFVSMAYAYPGRARPHDSWGWYESRFFEDGVNRGVFGGGEYIPNVADTTADEGYYRQLAQKGIEVLSGSVVTGERDALENAEALRLVYRFDAEQPAEVALPLNYSGLERMVIEKDDIRLKLVCTRTPDDPRMRIHIPAGRSTVVVFLPSFANIFR